MNDIQYNACGHSRRLEGLGPESAEIYLHPFDSSGVFSPEPFVLVPPPDSDYTCCPGIQFFALSVFS